MSRPKTGKTLDEKAFRELLKDYRIKNGYSMNKLAKILEMDQSSLSKYEAGKIEFSAKRMLSIAEKLDFKNKIINPLNFSDLKSQAVKILRIPILDSYPGNEKELEENEKKASKYLFFDLSFFPSGSFYAVENTENLIDAEKGEYIVINLKDKDVKEFGSALIKKNGKFFIRKLIDNKLFGGSKEYPDFPKKEAEIIGKAIMTVKLRKL